MKRPKYSFVVPVHNGEKTLAHTLQSIQEQTLKNFELLIVDNASDDGSAAVAKRFPGTYLFCKNLGRAKARNAGARRAQGEYLAFVDADVKLEKNWLKQVDRFLHRVPLDAMGTQIVPKGSKDLLSRFRFLSGKNKTNGTFLNLYHSSVGVLPLINTAACVFSRKSFESVGGFDDRLIRNEDLDLSMRLFHEGYLLGGTRRARATVRFETNSTIPFAEPVAYLKRAFEVSHYSLWKSSWRGLINRAFLRQLLDQKQGLRLFGFALSVEMASAAGLLFRSPYHQRNQRWKIRNGPNTLRFSFSHRGCLYVLKKGFNFIFIDEKIFLMLGTFRSTRLKPRYSRALVELLLKKTITSSTGKVLLEIGAFAALGS